MKYILHSSLWSIFIFLYICGENHAQVISTPYSYFGSGLIINNGFGVSKALGGTGIAYKSGNSLNNLNPASYNGIDSLSFLFEIGSYAKYSSYKTSNERSNKFDGNIQYLAMGFRLNKWWALSLGVAPFSSVSYNITVTNTIDGEPLTSFKVYYYGNGGINRFYFGNSFGINKHISLGINTSYILGSVTQTESSLKITDFDGYSLKKVTYIHSFLFDYGIQLNTNIGKWNYSLGLIYCNRKTLKSRAEMEFGSSYDTLEIITKKTNFIIPQKYGVGFAISKGDQIKIGLDYTHENWSDAKFSNNYLSTRDERRYSLGIEYCSRKNISDYGFKAIHYRLGVYYNPTYLIIDDTPIDTKATTFGLGLPLRKKLSMINISAELGQTGNTKKGLIKENYILFHLNFTLHDIWFQKLHYD